MGKVKQIGIKNRTYYLYDEKLLKITNLLKIDKKSSKVLVFTILDTLQLKKLMIVKIFTV